VAKNNLWGAAGDPTKTLQQLMSAQGYTQREVGEDGRMQWGMQTEDGWVPMRSDSESLANAQDTMNQQYHTPDGQFVRIGDLSNRPINDEQKQQLMAQAIQHPQYGLVVPSDVYKQAQLASSTSGSQTGIGKLGSKLGDYGPQIAAAAITAGGASGAFGAGTVAAEGAAGGGLAGAGGAGAGGTAATTSPFIASEAGMAAPTALGPAAASTSGGGIGLGSGATGYGVSGTAAIPAAGGATASGITSGQVIQGLGTAGLLAAFSRGGTKSTQTTTPGALSAEEQEFVKLQTELAQLQLKNLKGLEPFQQEILNQAMQSWKDQQSYQGELNKLVTPQQRAQAEAAEFTRAQKLGPMQDEILQMQLDQMRQGTKATPDQLASIREATDAGIFAGSADIDTSTQRGIGLISDELANSRGLRLTDSPIMNEAGRLARTGMDQKASLINNLRSNEAQARLNYPLAVQGLQSQINQNQQGILQNASQFQANLQQRAYQNRLALTGQASNTGIGLASINAGAPRGQQGSTTTMDRGFGLQDYGALFSGIGALQSFSDRRLKDSYGVVGKTDRGIDLHVYRFKGEDENDPLRLGVMADEVKRVNPSAVRTHRSGYQIVDYARL